MANNLPTIKPSLNLQFANTNAIPPDVTFTRASTSGGYYDGRTVVKAEENLYINSVWAGAVTGNPGTMPTSWTSVLSGLITVSGSAIQFTALTGSRTAIAQNIIVLAGDVLTFSMDVSAATGTGTDALAIFEVVSGAVLSGSTKILVSDGAGRKTCSTTVTTGGTIRVRVGASVEVNATTDCVATLTSPQIEKRSFATAYTPTTTQQITNYIPKMLFAATNVPVIDHNPATGERLGLAIWEARTNLLLYSQEFDNAYWTKTNISASASQIIAPDGTLTADSITEDTASGFHILQRLFTTTAVIYSLTIFAKAGTRNWFQLRITDGTNLHAGFFNLSTGVVGTVTSGVVAAITPVGNGWYRCSITPPSAVLASASGYMQYGLGSADNTPNYTGNGTGKIYIWGAQLEVGSFATPYIPTVASTVARSADAAVMTGVNFTRWFNNAQGCLVIDAVSVNAGSSTATITALGSADANNRILVISRTSGVTGSFASATANGSTQAELNGTHAASNKVAVSYAVNDYKGCLNGGAVSTDTTALVPVLNTLTIGATVGTVFSGYYKSIQYYPIALTSAQLQAVTA